MDKNQDDCAGNFGNGDWLKFKKLILFRLDQLDTCLKESDEKTNVSFKAIHLIMSKVLSEIAILKVKSGIWGAIGASAALILAAIIGLVFGNLKFGG